MSDGLKIDLQGRVALITGSSRGIGAAMAEVFAQAGAAVAINHQSSADQANAVADKITGKGGKAIVVQADIADEASVKRMFQEVDQSLGPVDILVNNAGTSQGKDIDSITPEDWDHVLRVNLRGMFLCSQQAVPRMRKKNWGRIINTGSIADRRGALFGQVHYAASKSAMVGFAKTLARTVAPHNITVNTLGVGVTDTELLRQTVSAEGIAENASMIPLGRLGRPQEVAYLCAFLASDLAGYITGAQYDINGGLVMYG